MKSLIAALVLFASPAFASEVTQFIQDTKEVVGKHYEGSYGFDFNGDENKEKLAIGSQVVAYRFLAIQPLLTYAPNAADSKVNVELAFPLRLGRVPIGGGREIHDLFPDGKIGGWVDKIGGGFWGKVNLTSGGWRFGWRLGFGNGK